MTAGVGLTDDSCFVCDVLLLVGCIGGGKRAGVCDDDDDADDDEGVDDCDGVLAFMGEVSVAVGLTIVPVRPMGADAPRPAPSMTALFTCSYSQ